MTPTEIATRVRNKFGDTRGSVLKDAMFIDSINEACVEIVRETLCLHAEQSAIAVTGFRRGTGVTLSANFILIKEVFYDDVPLALIDNETISRMNYYTLPDGIPEAYYMLGQEIFMFPNPLSTDTNTCMVSYVPMPAPITAIGNTIPIPVNYHNDVAEFCLILAHERNENWRAAEAIREKFYKNIAQRKYESLSQDDTFRQIGPDIMDQDYTIGHW